MRVEIFNRTPRPTEKVVRVDLQMIEDNVCLVEVDERGHRIENGIILEINPERGILLGHYYEGSLPKSDNYRYVRCREV